MVRAAYHSGRLYRGADALRARPRLDLVAGVDSLRPCGVVLVSRRVDIEGGRPRARRCVLRECVAAREGVDRSVRRTAAACAVHAGHRLLLIALRGTLLGDPRALA